MTTKSFGKLEKNGVPFNEKEQALIFSSSDGEFKDVESYFVANGSLRKVEVMCFSLNQFIDLMQQMGAYSWLYINREALTVMSSDKKYYTIDGNNYGSVHIAEGFNFDSIHELYEFVIEMYR